MSDLIETKSLNVNRDIIQDSEFQEFIKNLERSQRITINIDEVHNVLVFKGKIAAITTSIGQIQTRIIKMSSKSVKENKTPLTNRQSNSSNNHQSIKLTDAQKNFLELFGQNVLDIIQKAKGINSARINHDKLELSGDISVIEMIKSHLEQVLYERNIQITYGMKKHLESTSGGRMLEEFVQKYHVGTSLQVKKRNGRGGENPFRGARGRGNGSRGARGRGNQFRGGYGGGDENRGGRGRGNQFRGGYGAGDENRGGRGGGNQFRGGYGGNDENHGGRGGGNQFRGGYGGNDENHGGRGGGNQFRGGYGGGDENRGGRGRGNQFRGGYGGNDENHGGRGGGNQFRGGYGGNDENRGGRGGGNQFRGGYGGNDENHGGRGAGNQFRGGYRRGDENRGGRGREDFFSDNSPSHYVDDSNTLHLNTINTNTNEMIFDDPEDDKSYSNEHEDDAEEDNADDDDDESSKMSDSDISLSSNLIKNFNENAKKFITISLCSDSEDSLSKAVAELRSYSLYVETLALTEEETTFILKQRQRGKPEDFNNSIRDRSVQIRCYLVQFVHDYYIHIYVFYERGIRFVKITGQKQRAQSAISKIKSYLNDVVETEVQIPISKTMAFFLRTKGSSDIKKLEKKHNVKIVIFSPPFHKHINDDNDDNNCLKLIGTSSRVNLAQVDIENFLENLLEREENVSCNTWDLANNLSQRIKTCLQKIQNSHDYESAGLVKFYNSALERRETTPKITFTIVSLDEETANDVIQQCTDIIEGYIVWKLTADEYRTIEHVLMKKRSPSIQDFQQEWNTNIQLERDTNTIIIPARSKQIADEIKEALQHLSKGGKPVSVKRITEIIPIPLNIRYFVNQAIRSIQDDAKARKVSIDSKNRAELKLHGYLDDITPIKEQINTIVKDIKRKIITYRLSLSLVESDLLRNNSYEILKSIQNSTNTIIRDVKIDSRHSISNKNTDDTSTTLTTVVNNRGQTIFVKKGDITKAQDVDVIVNAANGKLDHAGGIDKVIADAAGPALVQECQQLIVQNGGVAISAGKAVKTTAGNLPFKCVIHAIGPQYADGNQQERQLLFLSVFSSLKLAEQEGYHSIALPAISSVTYGFPLQDCTNIIIRGIKQFFADFPQSHVRKVILLDIDDSACNSFAREVDNDHTNAIDNDNITNYVLPSPLTSKWCWQDDYDEKIYDENHTRQIEDAFQQYLKTNNPPPLTIHVDNLKTSTIIAYSIHLEKAVKETLATNPNAINARLVCGYQMRVDTDYKRYIIRYPLIQKVTPTSTVVHHHKPLDKYNLQVLTATDDWNIISITNTAVQQAEIKIREVIESATVSEPFSVNLNDDIDTYKSVINNIAMQQSIQVDFQQDHGGQLSLILKGLNQNVLQAKLKISLYAQDILRMEVDKDDELLSIPKEWGKQEEQCKLVEVQKDHSDFIRIEKRMKETMNSIKVEKIERVQNLRMWNHYAFRRQTLKQELNHKPDLQIEMELFHGTRNTPSSEIYNGEYGFDMTFCTSGLWGLGTYFAKNASYSCTSYSHQLPNGKRQVFLAQVLTGEVYDYKDKNDSTLRRPPKKNESISGLRYNSVSGQTGGSQVYIVYENRVAYPTFLITFTP